MLVLTRKPGQSIVIDGDEIVITVLEIRGEQVRLGVEAPRSVSVHRQEIYEAIRLANAEAAAVAVDLMDGVDLVDRAALELRG